ncbi:hypothetical protein CLOP_g10195 [Closterium sp. NIES-67]|nr:hypothetical protein CLOP_g10195 [Closterium sp. NIES-67]
MPPPVVPAVPAAGHSLHDIEGVCDYCGEPCDSTQDELNALACTFEGCASSGVYHQHCIEAFLKSIRLDKQRKTGFQCPRGNGKATKFDKPCPGRITKSHPIHARNENSKKRRKAKMPEPPPAPVGAAGKKGGKGKDDKKADSKAVDGKKEGKAADSKKEGKSKSSFLVPSSSSKSSASAPAAPAAPAPKPTVALLVRSSLPPAAKAAAKSSSAGTDPLSPSSKSGGIGSSGAGASGGGSGGVAVKVLSKSWSAAAAGLKDAAAAAVGSVSGSSGSGGGGVPVNAWSSSPGIVSAPSKGKSSESKADKVSSPKDPSSQQDASTGGKASDKPAAGGGGEEKSKKDKAGGKGSSQDGEGKTENGGGSGKGEGKGRQKKKGKEQVVPAPAVPAPVTAAVPANSVWKAKPAALLLRPEAGKAQGQNQQQAQSQQQPHQQKQPPQQQQQQQQGKQEGKATRESQVKSDTTVAPSSLPPPSVPPPIKTTTTVSPDPPASSAHLPPSTSLSVWTKDSSLHSSTLHTSSLHSAPPSSSSSSSSSSTTPTECEFSTTSGLSSPPSSFPSTPRAMTSLSPSASMSSCADHLAPEPVTEPASSPAAEPVAEPSVVGSEAPSSSGEGGRRVGTEVSIQDGLQEKADSQVQQQQQQQQPPQQHQKQSQQQQQQQQDKVVVAEDVAAAAAAAAAAEASKGSSVSNASNAAGSGDASPAASTVATGAVPSATASNVAASVGATNMSTAGDMPGAAVARSPTGGLRRWSDACRFALETNRRRVYVRQLQELGFPLGEAAQAVLVHGGDLGGCLNHLLVLHECSCRPSALSASTPSPFVDISLELQALSEIMSAGSLPQDLLEHALVLASGDISHALHLIISHPHGLPSSLPSTQPFPFYSSPLSSSTTTTTTTAATAATATTTTSSSPHSSLPPPHPFLSNHCIPQHPTAFPVGPSDPVFAHLSRSSSPSPSPSPPSPLPDYTVASPASFSHTPFTTLTPTTTPSSSVHHTSLLSGIWSSSSPNLPSAAHASPVPPPGFGPSLSASPAPLGNSSSFGTLETPPNLSSGSGWNFNGLPELKSQQRAEPVGGCEATRKVYVPESIGRLWGGAGGAGMAAQEDSQWLCGVNSDRSSGTASGLSSCSNSSHGYSQFSEDDGLGDSLLLLPGDEEDLFSRILPGLLG